MDVFSAEDVTPEETSERRAKRCAKCSIVDAERHGIDRSPECPVTDFNSGFLADLYPGLDDAADKDGGTDVRSCKLIISGILANHARFLKAHMPENSRCTEWLREIPFHQ